LEGLIIGSKLTTEVSGVLGTEVGELLCWITTALRSHSFSGITKCTPSIKCIGSIKPDYFVNEKSTTVSLEFNYTLEKDLEKTNSINGLCWREIFNNPIIAEGFRIRRRPKGLSGLESSLGIMSDVVDELYRKIEPIQAHVADKEDKDGIGAKIRLSMRRNLEGFDFCDIAYENGPIRAKATTLQSSGKGWVDMARAIDSITIFGTGFGELLLPSEDATLCAPWKTLPQNKDYLAASMQVINDLRSKQETPLEGEPLQLADGIYWHTPDQCFAACHCTGKQTSRFSIPRLPGLGAGNCALRPIWITLKAP
jgi:hypothetical protein